MMVRASSSSVFAAAGLILLAMPMPSLGAEQGWTPVVAKAGKAKSPRSEVSATPRPRAKQATKAKKKAAQPVEEVGEIIPLPYEVPTTSTSAGADAAAISTGSIETLESTRSLSPEDSARLFADADNAAPATTGAVGIQGSDLAQGYCASVADAAADARIAWQKAKLAEIEREIAKRIAALEAKTAEYKSWLQRRDEFLKRANTALVQIYTQMEPDAAALQLVSMDEETAAALLTKLDPQNASAILNEMQADKAARLTATISGAARLPKPNRPPAPPPPPPGDGEPVPIGPAGPGGGRS
jgi:flagellar motility protein MotE (MotC chaperone)